jgi:hypothetical protein
MITTTLLLGSFIIPNKGEEAKTHVAINGGTWILTTWWQVTIIIVIATFYRVLSLVQALLAFYMPYHI